MYLKKKLRIKAETGYLSQFICILNMLKITLMNKSLGKNPPLKKKYQESLVMVNTLCTKIL